MEIEASYLKAVIKVQKQYPVLKQPYETKVQISVRQIVQIAKTFHDEGFNNNDLLSFLK